MAGDSLTRHHLQPTNSHHSHHHSCFRVCFTHGSTQVRPFQVFFDSHRKCTGTTPLGFLCFTQEVRRYDTFKVSLFHTGSTQVRHLQGFFATHSKYTGTTPLGFLCFTQELHKYNPFRVSLLHTGSAQVRHLLGFFASHRNYTSTTPLGFLCYTQESLELQAIIFPHVRLDTSCTAFQK